MSKNSVFGSHGTWNVRRVTRLVDERADNRKGRDSRAQDTVGAATARMVAIGNFFVAHLLFRSCAFS